MSQSIGTTSPKAVAASVVAKGSRASAAQRANASASRWERTMRWARCRRGSSRDAVGEKGAAPILKVNTHTRSCRSSASSAASAIAGAGCAAAADPPEALLPPRLDGLGSSGKVAAS